MTEEQPQENIYETLKNEMQSQYNELKSAFEQSNKEKDDLIASLKSQNEDLQRALVRTAFTVPEPEEQPKSEEEIYMDHVQHLLRKAKTYSKLR